jgi:RNA polymerase primary sigma factor
LLEDVSSHRPDEAVESVLVVEMLAQALSALSEREQRVLELRYGLNGERPRTLDEVGRDFNVTRERIRQIESQSLRKLATIAGDGLRDVA